MSRPLLLMFRRKQWSQVEEQSPLKSWHSVSMRQWAFSKLLVTRHHYGGEQCASSCSAFSWWNLSITGCYWQVLNLFQSKRWNHAIAHPHGGMLDPSSMQISLPTETGFDFQRGVRQSVEETFRVPAAVKEVHEAKGNLFTPADWVQGERTITNTKAGVVQVLQGEAWEGGGGRGE